jgi:hypothetical protein
MIKAAVYQAARPKGVTLKTIPLPQLSGATYVPNEGNYPKQFVMTALSLFMTVLSSILSFMRLFVPGIPPTFGACEDRHMILCKVIISHLILFTQLIFTDTSRVQTYTTSTHTHTHNVPPHNPHNLMLTLSSSPIGACGWHQPSRRQASIR